MFLNLGAKRKPGPLQALERTGVLFCFPLLREVLRKQGPGRTPAQDGPRIVVHPRFGLGYLRRRHFIKVSSFRKKPADDPVHVFVGASLRCAVWVAVIYRCAGFSVSEGFLHSVAILKLAPVVHGDRLEYLSKVLPQLSLQLIQHFDYAGHRVICYPENEAVSCEPFRQYHKGGFTSLATHYAVHFPMSKGLPFFGLSGSFGWLRLFLVVLTLIEQMLFGKVHKNIAPVNVVIKRILAYLRGKLEALLLDAGQGGSGGKVFVYDLVL